MSGPGQGYPAEFLLNPEERARLAGQVRVVCAVLALCALPAVAHNAWVGTWASVGALGLGELCLLAALWVNSRNRTRQAILLVIAAMLLVTTLLLWTSVGGLRDASLLILPSIIVVAGLLVDKRSLLVIATAAMLCAGSVGLAETLGWRVWAAAPASAVRFLFDVLVILLLTALLVGTLSEGLRESLARARANELALKESQEHLAHFAEATFEGIGRTEQGTIVEVNRQLAEMHGYEPAEMVGRPVLDFVAPESRESVLQRLRASSREPDEFLALRKDGSTFPAESRARTVGIGGREVRFTALRDLTQRKRAEEALRLSEARYRTLFDSAADAIFLMHREEVVDCNSIALRMFACRRDELLGQTPAFVSPEFQPDGQPSKESAAQRIAAALTGAPQRFEWRHCTREGRLFDAEVSLNLLPLVEEGALLAIVRDISERKRAQAHLEQSREQLRRLSARLQSLREEERTHIAREIHDHLGQLLTALKLDLRSAERRLQAAPPSEASTVAREKIVSALGLADETIGAVQKIASELRPGLLDRLGLSSALEAEAQTFCSRTGLACDLRLPRGLPALLPEQATAMFRIFQEILTNVARHAQASRLTVTLAAETRTLVLSVRDNGVGIRVADLANPASLGILGMRERAAMLNGTVEFEPASPRGTTVTVRLPCGQ